MDPIKTKDGYISGTVLGEPGNEIRIYRGVPYAAPPVGNLRWKPPQPVTPWKGTRECTAYSIQAAQFPDSNMPEEVQKIPSSEDCLYLNILTPSKKTVDRLPVMVWLHGGGLRYGSGNSLLYNSLGLPQHGVVLVTVNTRLGVMGLFSHPLLIKESTESVSGNYMFLDMIAALKWVKSNITAFGGDPDNITIFGESGGGLKVIALMASPLAKGLFHRAICERGGGGSRVLPPTINELAVFGEKLFAKLGVSKGTNQLAAARAINWEKIIEIDQALNIELSQQYVFMGPWTLAIDGWFMPDSPPNIFKAGKQNDAPLITLANLGELTGPGYVYAPYMIPGYVSLLSGMSKIKCRGYAGIFDQMPINWRKEGGVATHAMEMHYVFGALDNIAEWENIHFLYASGGAKSKTPLITDADRNVSEAMMKIWVKFAKTGDPSVRGLVNWPSWEEDTDSYLYITEPLQVKSGFSKIAQQ